MIGVSNLYVVGCLFGFVDNRAQEFFWNCDCSVMMNKGEVDLGFRAYQIGSSYEMHADEVTLPAREPLSSWGAS